MIANTLLSAAGALAVFLTGLAPVQAAAPSLSVSMSGLSWPTAMNWDLAMKRVYVTTKAGKVFMAQYTSSSFPSAFPTTPILDISSKVAQYGDLGLSSLDVYGGYLYIAYNNQSQWGANGCTDYGTIANRTLGSMTGCPTGGVVSRFQLDAATGGIAGPEQVIYALDTTKFCVQFMRYSFGSIKVVNSGNDILVAVGAGMNGNTMTTQPDYGQYGGDPCGQGGAFRALTSPMINGKILTLNVNTGAVTNVLAKGLKNPFRFSFTADGSALYVIAPGFSTYESIYGPLPLATTTAQSKNYGFPCWDGPDQFQPMRNTNASACDSLAASGTVSFPFYKYTKASTGAAAVSVSSVAVREAGSDRRLYYGDYSQGIISSVSLSDPTNVRSEVGAYGAFPVDMAYFPSIGVCYTDIVGGAVNCLANTGEPNAASATVVATGAVAAFLALVIATFISA